MDNFERQQPDDASEEAGIDENDMIEVIDLDEELGDGDEWEDERDEDEGAATEEKQVFQPIDGVPVAKPGLSFSKHDGSVFSTALDPVTNTRIISGGEDDKAYLWNVDDGNLLFVCNGHTDSVVQVGVSHDGIFAFSADMAGVIKVWNLSSAEEVWSTETSDLKVAKWHSKAHVLFAGCDDGSFYMWQIPSGQCKYHQFMGSVTTLAVFPDGKRIGIAYGDGAAVIFDLKEWKPLHVFPERTTQTGEILSVDVNPEGTLLAAGTALGRLIVMHAGNGRIVWENEDADFGKEGNDDRSVESLAFDPHRPWLAAAGLNGVFCIYDLSSWTKRHSCSHPNLEGISCLLWHPTGESVLASHLNGVVSKWNSRTGTLEQVFYGGQEEILDLCISTDGRRLVSASDDGIVCVFSL